VRAAESKNHHSTAEGIVDMRNITALGLKNQVPWAPGKKVQADPPAEERIQRPRSAS
jgi:hypothetical protein